jgi:hypothetical protein
MTYGAHKDAKSGKNMFEDIDPNIASMVHSLGVADAGELKSNEIVV